MAPLNLPLAFGALLAGAVIIDYGLKSAKDAFAAAPAGTSSPAAVVTSSGATGPAVTGGAHVSPGSPGGYVNPFAKASGLVKERVDMGWDFHTSGPGQPILSIGDAKITGILQGWYQGQPLIETQLLNGSHADQFVYYAEGLIPTVSVGQTVNAGDQIATTTSQPSGLELGFGGDAAGTTLAQTQGQTNPPTHANTPAGQSFQQFLQSIGV